MNVRWLKTTKGTLAPVFDVTIEEYEQLRENSAGLCFACGEEQCSGVEPDAERYPCESCEAERVYGIEQALIFGRVKIVENSERAT